MIDLEPTKYRDIPVILLHSRMSKVEKQRTIFTIKNAPRYCALMTFDIGATGHNFQEANQVLFIDRHWNPQVNIPSYVYVAEQS